jgi:hypothetical protein
VLLAELSTGGPSGEDGGAKDGGEDPAFTFGRLHALEEQRAAEAEKEYFKAWKKAWKRFKDSAPL